MSLADIIGILGLLVGIAGIGIGYYFYRKSFASKAMASRIRNIALLEPQQGILPPEVEIFFSGRQVESLSQANCVIWNCGRTTINGQDVKSEYGIAILLRDGDEILNISVKNMSVPENKVVVEKATVAKVCCRFAFLDPGQGFNVNILYTGKSATPIVRTVIAGMPKGITGPEREAKNNQFIFPFVMVVMGVMFLGFFLRDYYGLSEGIGMLIVYALVGFFTLFGALVFKMLQKLPPQVLISSQY